MKKTSYLKRITALFLSVVMVIGLVPNVALTAVAADRADLTAADKVVDPSSFDNWKDYYGANSLLPDGTRGTSTWKAGGVWTDKSVYNDSTAFPDSVTMNNRDKNFLVALSALASNKEIVGQSSTPTDTMLVLDLSQSMDNSGSVDDMIAAANETLDELLKMNVNNRVGVVLYSGNSNTGSLAGTNTATVILPLDRYTTTTTTTQWEDGQRVTKYHYLTVSGTNDTTVSVAAGTLNSKKDPPSGSKKTDGGTYIQNGLFKAWQEFSDMEDNGVVQSGAQAGVQRQPILILMSDGRPTLATADYNNVGTSNSTYGTGSNSSTTNRTVFLTQLTAAWVKGAVKDHYNNADVKFYTLGLSTGNDTYATNVLNPGSTTDTDMLNWWSNFITGAKRADGTVRVRNASRGQSAWDLPYDDDRFATGVGRNYTDGYWSAGNVDDMIEKFKQIVAEIGLQSAYSATLVESGNADLDGYITVQDELGAMMQVKDVKGILIGDTLFSGAELARSMDEGHLGSSSNPQNYGDVFVQTVKERIGIADTSVAQDLIRSAYHSNQLHYASADDYSNYIGWYGGSNNEYLGFWQESYGYGMEGAPAGVKYINKSYGYLGGSADADGAADMMHIVVMVRTEISTGHQTVLFKIPSSLIPMVEYKVALEGDSLETATEITLSVTEADPIRLVYEVGLPDDVNNINIARKVAEYLAKDGSNHIHTDDDGNYVFYANNWDDNHDGTAPVISNLSDEQKLALTNHVAESHFVPNTANERFYVQEDAVVYTKNGNNYTPVTTGINANGTYYYARTIVTIVNGKAQAVSQYEQLQPVTIANSSNFQRNADTGYWEVKAGTVRQQLSNVILPKDKNETGTIANTDQLWVNVTGSDPTDFNIYSFLGNNGKLTVAPATGIKVTKDVTEPADGAAADEEFPITVTIDAAVANPTVTDVDGNLIDNYTSRVTLGKTVVTLNLADNESAVIAGLPANVTYTVTEAAHKKYTGTYTGATATVAGTIVEGVVTNRPIKPGNLYITKEVAHSTPGETFPTDYEFEFEVTFIDADGNPIANTVFQLENNYESTLTELKTDADGVMKGKLRHGETVYIKDIPAGTVVTVEEVSIPDNYPATAYRSRNASGLTADNDGVVTIISDADATVVVTNTYTPKQTSVNMDLAIEKILRVDTQPTEGMSFAFQLEKWNGTRWESMITYNDVGWSASQIKTNQDNVLTEDIFADSLGTFTEAGTYTYRVYEVYPDAPIAGMTYDRTIYTITVTVTDVNGQLVAVVTDNNNQVITDTDNDGKLEYTATFTNEAHAAPVSIDIVKDVKDTSENPVTSKAGFEFVAVQTDDNWAPLTGNAASAVTVYSDGQGNARLAATYKEAGSYYFVVTETDGGKSGWTYSDAEYKIEVKVTEDATGDLSATIIVNGVDRGDDNAAITFENTYDPDDTQVALGTLVKKDLKGRDLMAGEFTFAIFENNEAEFVDGKLANIEDALATGTNDANGNVTFTPDKLTFSKVGKYEYDIVEVKGDKGGVTYDATIYDLAVEVSDNGDGTLRANYYFEDSVGTTVTFKNTYTVTSTEVVIDGKKTLEVNSGVKALNAGDYTFCLYNEADEKIGETTNLANGTFKFDAIEYDADDINKTYTYTVKEQIPAGAVLAEGKYVLNGVTYSAASYTVIVKVKDNGDGTLSTEVIGNGAQNIHFVNEYDSNPVSVTLPGKKALKDRNLTAQEFKFALYSSNAGFTSRTLLNDKITHDISGDFSIDFGTLGMGYHYFVVREVIPEIRSTGVQYDAGEYYITIQVIDSGNGQMSALTTVKHSGDPNAVNPAIAFNNIYQPEPDELVLSGTKTYNGGKTLEDDVFSVGLYDDGGNQLDTADVKASGSFTFNALEYTAADVGRTYTYTVKEILPNGATDNGDGTFTFGNNIYDGTVYTVKVTITDPDQDGALDIAKTVNDDRDGTISFTNTFVPDPITYDVQAKKTYEKGLKGGDFEFKLVSADNKTNVDQTKENIANGDIIFDPITFSEAGEYKFKLTEKKDSIVSFILPSQAEYEITITVVNENGVLRVSDVETVNTKNTGETNLEFINTYVMDGEGEITLRGTKKLNGDRTTVKADEFEFGLYDAAGNLLESVKNDANGNFAFTTLEYDEKDVPVNGQKQITYTVQEIAGDNARYTYDDTVYTVVVTVKDNDQGGIDVSRVITSGGTEAEIIFTNTYTNPAPVTYTPMAKKHYNKTLNGGEFKFALEGEINGTPVSQEKTNAAGGSITFDTLSFPEAGTYSFTVKEIDKVLGFIEYSAAEYELVVNVIDTKGVLSLGPVTVNNGGTMEFTNTYVIDGEDEITIRGTKTLTGGRTAVEANEFEFGLYDAEGKLVESVKNDADGNFAFTTLKYDEKDVPVNGQKQITYTVKEIAGSDIRVTYDDTVYTVVVTVKDNDQGGVTASYTVGSEADGSIAFTNIYTPQPEDITVDFDIVKTVVNKGSEKIGPEGFEFLLNALADGVADVTVKADENGKAKFTLTFTEDDIDKTYTYKLTEVNGGKANVTYSAVEYTVTVAISLNENNELVATLTKNGENAPTVVAEFENVYDYTPTPPNPEYPESPDTPQTGDTTNLHLWFVLLFVSGGGGIFATTLYVRKKKEET